MSTKLHKDMVQACAKIFPQLHDERVLRTFKFKEKLGINSLPDLAAPDNSLAVECETLGQEKIERFHKHKRYKELLLVIPLFENINEIWMYSNGEFRKFSRTVPEKLSSYRSI